MIGDTPARWAMQTDEDRGDLACAAELWVLAHDPADSEPEDRATYLDTVRWIAGDIAKRTTLMLAEIAPRPPTSYCAACRAWCRDPHTDCVGVPLWVRMQAVRYLGMYVPAITDALRSGALVYDPAARTIHRPEATHVG
jgi:hypothetical protein